MQVHYNRLKVRKYINVFGAMIWLSKAYLKYWTFARSLFVRALFVKDQLSNCL